MCATDDTKAYLHSLFATHFGDAPTAPLVFASAPGRVELAGNHTDHQGGRTISAAIDQRAYALAAPNNIDEIRVFMDGFGKASVRLSELDARECERETSLSLIRGMAAASLKAGREVHGFDAVTCSRIPVGCGLSSSAAFEMLLGVLVRALADSEEKDRFDPIALALEGAWAERNYFGKPCGTQDQLASAFGGIAAMDFSSTPPRVSPISFDLQSCAYSLLLIDSQLDHSAHTHEYAAISDDMHAVAAHFGCSKLEKVPLDTFLEQFVLMRTQLGDLKALRALHYFEETRRVQAQEQALLAGDFERFLEFVRLSGASSAQFLQNVSPLMRESNARQSAMVILALCMHLLDGNPLQNSHHNKVRNRGAYRIHGGGFGGSVLAFVPHGEADSFQASMNGLLGYDACMTVSIDPHGASYTRLV